MKFRIAFLLILGSAPGAQLHAQEPQASATFRVQARVEAACEIVSSDLNRAKRALLRATCTPDATYQVSLNRVSEAVTGVGTGSVVDHTLFGGAPAARVVRAGDYTDTVTVHVYY